MLSVTDTEQSAELDPGAGEGFQEGCFRADLSGFIQQDYPLIVKIDSVGRLHDYYENNKDTYQFNQIYNEAATMTDAVFGEKSGYDEVFFESRFLLFVILEEGSGSVRHKVESANSESCSLSVNITRIIPEIGTADIAVWYIVLAPEKALLNMDVKIILSERRGP